MFTPGASTNPERKVIGCLHARLRNGLVSVVVSMTISVRARTHYV